MMGVRIRWEADFEVDSDSQEDLVDAARKAVGQISDPNSAAHYFEAYVDGRCVEIDLDEIDWNPNL